MWSKVKFSWLFYFDMLLRNFYLITIFHMTKFNLPVIVFSHYIGQKFLQFSFDRFYILGGSVICLVKAYLSLGDFNFKLFFITLLLDLNWFIVINGPQASNLTII